jgi:hypothetical protein
MDEGIFLRHVKISINPQSSPIHIGQETSRFLVKAGQLYYNKQRNYGILAM